MCKDMRDKAKKDFDNSKDDMSKYARLIFCKNLVKT